MQANKMKQSAVVLFLALATGPLLWPHGGGTVKSGCLKGCHNNRSAGTYHCHETDGRTTTYSSEQVARNVRCAVNPPPSGEDNGDSGCSPTWDYDPDNWTYSVRDQVLNARGDATKGWTDYYTGIRYWNPNQLHIDHVVSRKEAHDTGGYYWCAESREIFSDDLVNLVVTHKDVNLEKGSKGPEDWLTTTSRDLTDERVCNYLTKYLVTKLWYGLEIGERQRLFVSDQLQARGCWGAEEE